MVQIPKRKPATRLCLERRKRPPAAPSFPPCRKRWGRKGALVTVWCVLRGQSRQVLIFSCYEHTNSPYGRYSTRRLLRDTKFMSSCDLISAVKTHCVQNLQSSTNSPMACPKPPLAAPCAVRGGGIFEENDGGDMLQDSECSEIYSVRIPSVSFADSSPCAQGEPWVCANSPQISVRSGTFCGRLCPPIGKSRIRQRFP